MYDKLVEYSNGDYYPMHMPGHKRNKEMLQMVNPYSIDITEIDGFDNLHHAEGILREGMSHAAALYGSEHTNYLIGSSTSGILAGVAACTKKGDKILVARNSHKAVYHAIYLNELVPIYIYPQLEEHFGINGGISPKTVEELLIKHQNIKLIIITSPTYEGVVSDVKTIGEIAHKYLIPLLVDEAHGAHLGFHPRFPKSSVQLGADVVIHSLHKTLPAFTQTGLIHINGKLVNYEEVERYLGIYQSSSPSYLLMASIEQCVTLLEQRQEELFSMYEKRLQLFYDRMNQLRKLKLLTREKVKKAGFYDFDSSKITISVKGTNITGNQLYYKLLKPYKIQMEMVSKDYVLGMTSICDTEEGFKRLGDALLEIDSKLCDNVIETNETDQESAGVGERIRNQNIPEIVMLSHNAYEKPSEVLSLPDSIGRVTAEYVYLYPPGIPLLVPGERINKSLVTDIVRYKESGLSIQGMQERDGEFIKVVMERKTKDKDERNI